MEKKLDFNTQTSEELVDRDILKCNNDFQGDINLELKTNSLEIILGKAFTYTIMIENKSNNDLFNVKIAQKIQQRLKVLCVIIDSINIRNLGGDNDFITFYLGEIKAKEYKMIEVVAQVIDNEESELVINYAVLTGKYLSSQIGKKDIIVKSNTCNINVSNQKLWLRHKSSMLEAVVGETITFKLVAENKGEIEINNVIIRDLLNSEFKFLSDTIKVDGVSKLNESILTGINIGKIEKGCSKEIEFKAIILSRPENGVITNVAVGQYQYKIKNCGLLRGDDVLSDEAKILTQLISIQVDKKADKKEVSLGDEITYTIDFQNNGTIEAKNLVLTEIMSNELILIEDKFTINGRVVNNVDLSKGISIGDLKPEEKRTITYKTKYIKVNNRGKIINTTIINFDYKQKSGLIFKGSEIKKSLELSSNISTFKYMSISEKVYKEKNKPSIGEVDNVTADIDIIEYHLVKTIQGKSNEGQILTGYKIVVQGIIKVIIEYTSNENEKVAYSLSSYIPFSTFIVLPSNFKEGSKINIDYKVENISFKHKDIECVYINMCLLLIAKIQPVMC